jgi:hypothetical protein
MKMVKIGEDDYDWSIVEKEMRKMLYRGLSEYEEID